MRNGWGIQYWDSVSYSVRDNSSSWPGHCLAAGPGKNAFDKKKWLLGYYVQLLTFALKNQMMDLKKKKII